MAYASRKSRKQPNEELSALQEIENLKNASLPTRLRRVFVIIDHNPCPSCLKFLTALRKATEIDFIFKQRPFLVRGVRSSLPTKNQARNAEEKNDAASASEQSERDMASVLPSIEVDKENLPPQPKPKLRPKRNYATPSRTPRMLLDDYPKKGSPVLEWKSLSPFKPKQRLFSKMLPTPSSSHKKIPHLTNKFHIQIPVLPLGSPAAQRREQHKSTSSEVVDLIRSFKATNK